MLLTQAHEGRGASYFPDINIYIIVSRRWRIPTPSPAPGSRGGAITGNTKPRHYSGVWDPQIKRDPHSAEMRLAAAGPNVFPEIMVQSGSAHLYIVYNKCIIDIMSYKYIYKGEYRENPPCIVYRDSQHRGTQLKT